MVMEIKNRDLAGKIGKIKVNGRKVKTPTLLPVINPKKQIVEIERMREIGVDGIITNAYLLWKDEETRKKLISRGIHDFFDFDGLIMTDSGAFQLMQYGEIDAENRKIVEFQRDIGVDIGVILDIPGLGNRERMEENVKETIKRAMEVQDIIGDSDTLWAGPVQGGIFEDLRRYSAKEMVELGFDYFAVGSVVPLLNRYDFYNALNALVWAREEIPVDRPVHFFGAGHPMVFSFGVGLGADVFDSAAYTLFANKGKYLTENGTRDINTMTELPCSCPICSTHTVDELKKDRSLLAQHNLYVTIEEMKRVREAIRQGTLWELLERRSRSHPKLFNAFSRFSEYSKFLEERDPLSKKRFFYLSSESMNRPEVFRHNMRRKLGFKTKMLVDAFPFKDVPIEVLDMYPFGQRELPEKGNSINKDIEDWEIVNGIIGYLYGYYDLVPENARIEKSKSTGRIRNVYVNDELWVVIRARDHFPILHGIAKEMIKRAGWTVTVSNGIGDLVKGGRTVFAKFVSDADKRIRPGLEVLIVDEDKNLLATGTAVMSGREMITAKSGIAVNTRKLTIS